jgi:hypothetical protein
MRESSSSARRNDMKFGEFPQERPSGVGAEDVWIFLRLDYGYLGLDNSDHLLAIFPVTGRVPAIGRTAGSIRLDYREGVRIRVEDAELLASCCIVSIAERSLDRSFWALTQSLSQDLQVLPQVTSQDFGRAFGRWEQLFQRRRRLSSDEEQGLWGELRFISQCKPIETAIACWRGPSAEDYDFVSGGVALEIKTSRRLGRHHLSHAQVVQATQRGRVYLVSLWIGEDPGHGLSLPDLVDLIAEQSQDPVTFEQRLLDTGYSHADRGLYERAFSLLDEFELYDMSAVPRVQLADPGVMSLSYVVQLDPLAAEPEDARGVILDTVFRL